MSDHPYCFVRVERRARKPHKCCECHGAIAVGETYVHSSGVWPDGPARFKACVDCDSLRTELDKGRGRWDDELTSFEGLSDALENIRPDGRDLRLRFVATKRKRGATIPDWMLEEHEPGRFST